MLAVALALGASLSWGVCDFVAGVKSRSLDALTVVFASQATGVAALGVVLAVAWPGAPSMREAAFGLGAGLAGSVGLFALYQGMATGAMGVVAPIAATAAAVPVAVGLAGGERPGPLQAAGMAAALVGVVLAAREPGAAELGRARLAAGVGFALVSAVTSGVFLALLAEGTEEGGVVWPVLFSKAAELAVFATAVAIVRRRLPGDPLALGALVLVGLLDLLGMLLFARATTEGFVSVVAVVASLYPVATIVLAHVVLGERVGLLQRAGAVGALGGAALIAAG